MVPFHSLSSSTHWGWVTLRKKKKQIWVPSRCSVFILSTHCLSSLVETEQNWNGVLYKIRPRLMETFQTLIKEMNRLGMIVDLSHSSVQVTGHPHPKWKLDFSSDRPWHFGDLGCSCDFLALLCSSIVQLGTKRTWPTPQADGTCFFLPEIFSQFPRFRRPRKAWWWSTSSPTS